MVSRWIRTKVMDTQRTQRVILSYINFTRAMNVKPMWGYLSDISALYPWMIAFMITYLMWTFMQTNLSLNNSSKSVIYSVGFLFLIRNNKDLTL